MPIREIYPVDYTVTKSFNSDETWNSDLWFKLILFLFVCNSGSNNDTMIRHSETLTLTANGNTLNLERTVSCMGNHVIQFGITLSGVINCSAVYPTSFPISFGASIVIPERTTTTALRFGY